MSDSESEGWQIARQASSIEDVHYITFRNDMKPINFLEGSYPLQPDMLLGWRPRLPIGPVPLSYQNTYLDWLVQYIHTDRRYRLIYLGPRHSNSVKVNQLYSYYWKARDKYSMNLQAVKQAVESTGLQTNKRVLRDVDEDFEFDSDFESGNLDAVIRTKSCEYDCFIRSDTNTKGHCNWYYFTVKRKKASSQTQTIKLNICNFTKKANLYNKGMKPFVRVGKQEGSTGSNWKQLGEEIMFVEKYCRYGFDIKHQQLQFTYTFPQGVDKVAFAYGIPYTYSYLQEYVKELKEKYPTKIKVETLCESLGGVGLPLLTITDKQTNPQMKQAVLISARMHPGESVSSHVLQGFINQLLSNQKYAWLLTVFEFRIVPMVNPDGVIQGNFRTSYSGKDLNRQFFNLNKLVFPQIYSLNELAKSIKKHYKQNFQYYFDFHGHSTKTNLFCYGPEHPRWNLYYLRCRAFAKIMEEIDPLFSYNKSLFTISEHKRSTGRANMFSKLKIPMTYTFEMSNGLASQGADNLIDLTHMHKAGVIVLQGFNKYAQLNRTYRPSPRKKKTVKALYNKQKIPKFNSETFKPNTVLTPPLVPKISSNKEVCRQPTVDRKPSQRVKSQYKFQSCKPLKSLNSKKNSKSKDKLVNKATPKHPNLKAFESESGDTRTILNQEQTQLKLKYNRQHALEALFKQIKNQSEETTNCADRAEGGSDSEDETDDLDRDQTSKLFQQIQNREIKECVQQHKRGADLCASLTVNLRKNHQSTDKQNQHVSKGAQKPPRVPRNLYVRSVTARIKRSLPVQAQPEKYLLAQKSFVLNL